MLVLFRSYITNRSNLFNDARIQNLIRSVGHTFSSLLGSLAVSPTLRILSLSPSTSSDVYGLV